MSAPDERFHFAPLIERAPGIYEITDSGFVLVSLMTIDEFRAAFPGETVPPAVPELAISAHGQCHDRASTQE